MKESRPCLARLLSSRFPFQITKTRMSRRSIRLVASLAVAVGTLPAAEPGTTGPQPKPAFRFRDTEYFHRWSANDQHEFTPQNQEDLEKWVDMITVNGYPDAEDGNSLAEMANAVLENYKNHQAKVLKTDSVPRTAERPAEHFIAVLFTRPQFIEVAFARFKLTDGMGCSLVYSHRIYGEKMGDQMNAWLSANGAVVEKALMEWNSMPSAAALKKDLLRTKS